VDVYITHIVAKDGVHLISRDGWTAAYDVWDKPPPPTRQEYLAKYSTLEADGRYWYKKESSD
jgi:hypothetical protein